MKDEVIWHYVRKGQYSVKSGYQIALSLKFPASLTSSAAAHNQWNTIWLLTLPEKIRIFAWRVAKNLLLSTENLWKRKNARNNWSFKGVKANPQVTVSKVEAVLEAYRRTQLPAATHIGNQRSPMLRVWNPPQRGYFKVNVDAATNSKKQIAGLGAIILDEAGNVIAATVKVSKFYSDVYFAEAEAIEWGL
ncbi:hypothetical protein AB3S75_015347 [Citrus x aurantiifolia]